MKERNWERHSENPLEIKERQYILIYGKHWYTDKLSENNTYLFQDLKIKTKKQKYVYKQGKVIITPSTNDFALIYRFSRPKKEYWVLESRQY